MKQMNQFIEYDLWKEHRAKMFELAKKRDELQRQHDAKAICRKCGKRFTVNLEFFQTSSIETFEMRTIVKATCNCGCTSVSSKQYMPYDMQYLERKRLLENIKKTCDIAIANAIFKMKDPVGMPEIEPDMLVQIGAIPYMNEYRFSNVSSMQANRHEIKLWRNEYEEQYNVYAKKYGRLDIE